MKAEELIAIGIDIHTIRTFEGLIHQFCNSCADKEKSQKHLDEIGKILLQRDDLITLALRRLEGQMLDDLDGQLCDIFKDNTKPSFLAPPPSIDEDIIPL